MITVNGLEPKSYHITPEGITALQRQLHDVKRTRLQIAEEMRDMTAESGFANALEDSMLTLSRSKAHEIDSHIALLERIIALAKVIENPSTNDYIQIGSKVVVKIGDTERHYVIVGPVEADPAFGRISHESPLGRSLLGKRVHDQIEVVSPKAQRLVATIVDISAYVEP